MIPLNDSMFKDLVENITDYAIFLLDVHGIICSWNKGALKFKQYTAEEIVGRHFSVFYTPEDLEAEKPRKELEIAKERGRCEDEYWRVRKDGTRFWANVVITSIYDSKGVHIGYGKVTKDLTEKIQEEGSLRTYKLFIENVQDYAILLLDLQGLIISWNEGAKRIKQYMESEVIGKHFSMFFTEKDIEAGKPAKELMMAKTHGRTEDECWRVRKNGEKFWANVVVTAIHDKYGAHIGYGKVTKDLTQAKRTQALEESSKMKSEFLANMSHEIRTPMNGLISAATLLSETTLNLDQNDLIRIITQSSSSLLRVVNDILEFSKMERNTVQLFEETFELEMEIETILRKYRLVAPDLIVSLHLGVDVPRFVVGDPLRVRQIINNLVDNAVKFTSKGSVNVYVDCVRNPHPSDADFNLDIVLQFLVKDTGIGIAEEDLPRLFQPFSQLESSNHKRFQGTGLGLSICKYLAELMGGGITAESAEGKGSTFSFTVHVKRSLVVKDVQDKNVLVSQFPSARVLVVEDNSINRQVAIKILNKLGYKNIIIAEDGVDALQKFSQQNIDIILMDIQMPKMDGLEATCQIRRVNKIIPIIAMTANSMREDREICLRRGMTDYISKPIDFTILANIMNTSLKKTATRL